uniref:RING-type domain-containing protein n=1 Tax=Myripristis murdjan TaxID=586833 RepID=A0A667WDV0_9TELE
MSSPGILSLLPEDRFQCSICLNVFSDPVTTPCGHNFCKACIREYWRLQVTCQCPLCRAVFPTRPPLKTDKTLHAAAQTEQATVPLRAGEVPCDLCPAKHRAVKSCLLKAEKSCLVCLASYCSTHLELHSTTKRLEGHKLVEFHGGWQIRPLSCFSNE